MTQRKADGTKAPALSNRVRDAVNLEAKLRGLGNLERQAAADSGAPGMPENQRDDAAVAAKQHLEAVQRLVRSARASLLQGDEVRYELCLTKARLEMAFARSKMRNAVLEGRIAKNKAVAQINRPRNKRASKATVEAVQAYAKKKGYPGGAKYDPLVAEMAAHFKVSESTITRRLRGG